MGAIAEEFFFRRYLICTLEGNPSQNRMDKRRSRPTARLFSKETATAEGITII